MSIFNFSHFGNLSEEQKAELKRLLTKLRGFTKSCKLNVVDLESNLLDVLRSSLKELLKTENINEEKIEEIFNNTVKNSLDNLSEALEKAYQEQLKTKDIFLFDGVVVEKCLNVLQKVLEFEQKLDEIYPDASKKIIESVENILVAVISTQMPILGVFIEASGVLEKVNDLIDHEKLLPKITRLHDDIKKMRQEIKGDKNLGDVLKKAEKVAEISEISQEPVKKVIEVVNNPKNKDSIEKVIEAAEAIPKNAKEVEKKISEIKDNIEKEIPKDMDVDKLSSVKNSIADNLNDTKAELLKVLNPETSFADKITSLFKAAEKVTEIASDVKKIVGVIPESKNIATAISSAIASKILPQPVVAIASLAPEVANLVKVGKAVITLLSKKNEQNLNQEQGRAK